MPSIPASIRSSTLRLAGAQVYVSATLPLNASVGAVAAKTLSHHESLAGTSVGVAFLFSMASLAVVGSVAQNLGRRPILLVGMTLLAIGATLCGLASIVDSYPLFVIGTAIFGCGQGPSMMGRAAAADLYPTSLRGRGVGLVASAGAVGAVLGPLLAIGAAHIGETAFGLPHRASPFLTVPFIAIVALLLIRSIRPDPRDVAQNLPTYYPDVPVDAPLATTIRSRTELLRLHPVRAAIAATALAQGAMVGVMSITSVVLSKEGWSDTTVQLLMAAHFIGMFALSAPIGVLADRIGRRQTSLLGIAVCMVGALGTPLAGNSPWIAPFFFLLGLGWSGCFVAGTAVMADVTSPAERSPLTATNDLLVAGFAALASLSAGPILSTFGYWAVGVLWTILALFAFPLLLTLGEPTAGTYRSRDGQLIGRDVATSSA